MPLKCKSLLTFIRDKYQAVRQVELCVVKLCKTLRMTNETTKEQMKEERVSGGEIEWKNRVTPQEDVIT